MLFTDACTDFLTRARYERGLARRTLDGYQSWLRHFALWHAHQQVAKGPAVRDAIRLWQKENRPCQNWDEAYPLLTRRLRVREVDIADFTVPTLRQYLYWLAETCRYRPRTIRGAFAPLVALGDMLEENDAVEENPARQVQMPKRDAAVRKEATDEEVEALLAACERLYPERRGILARAMLSVLAFGGLRRDEALSLRVDDVDTTSRPGSVLIRRAKANKSRRVFLPDVATKALRDWLTVRARAKVDWLFAYDAHRRIGDSGLRALLREVKSVAGLSSATHLLPHSIRHNFATRMLHNGADLRDVQAALGHSTIVTTSVYLHSSEQRQREVAHLAAISPPAVGVPLPRVDGPRRRRALRKDAAA